MKLLVLYTAWLSFVGLSEALFIPEELPTLLSFLYTNIPPIFKGTDSRLGVGFRVGPNADFQIQVELGPQTRTQPLGPDAEGSSKKRHVPELDQAFASSENHVYTPNRVKTRPDTPIGWLHTWKSSLGSSAENELTRPNNPALDYDVVKHLQQLYKVQPINEMDEVIN
ncbi:uncharacterized protein LOC128992432 [Macrosteles quadrilineatus]|uniref:uncharacterized protein LOC128992336 n=1 Tax=Macrosteles quadrilineatus TaxID=74068 RepID=UPI0023E1ECA3|nr:uncharacterized protein LOC128992336 [Macrosteles quadrilineatus]XP_054271981.1 uncharacterized protein LOC128992432 [Macrosteles quadrilineatus]